MRGALAALAVAAAPLAGCGPEGPAVPPFYLDLGQRDASVDAQSALVMINGYRANKGLAELRLDPVLQRVAQDQARAMAAAGSVDVSLKAGNRVRERLDRAGYPAGPAVENVSAGYRTLAEAFSGWRDSPKHDATMREATATRMGIATAYAPGNKYKVFWSLVMAGPASEAASSGGAGGPAGPAPSPKP